MNSTNAERQELERAIELLGRSTRHARLWNTRARKYFQQQEDQLTEFNIATEVFGRSANRFDSTQDAVVRVEVHRLRKKLREIYEKDVRTEGLQISLPAGTYVPKFTPVPTPRPDSLTRFPTKRVARVAFPNGPVPLHRRGRRACSSQASCSMTDRRTVQNARRRHRSQQNPQRPRAPAKDAITELHIMAGYRGSEVIDNSGVRWTPDRYFAARRPMVERQRPHTRNEPAIPVCELENRRIRIRHPGGARQLRNAALFRVLATRSGDGEAVRIQRRAERQAIARQRSTSA